MDCARCGSPLEGQRVAVRRCPRCGHETLAMYAPPAAPYAAPGSVTKLPTRGLVRTVMIGLGLACMMRAFGIVFDLVGYTTYPGAMDKEDYENTGELVFVLVNALHALGWLAIFLFTVVVFCLWIYRSNAALRAAGVYGLNFTPGWAVGWWFVPFANLFKPYQVMRELWDASAPDRVDTESLAKRTPPFALWWGLWIVGNFIDNAAARLAMSPSLRVSPGTEFAISALGSLVGVPVAVLAAWIVWAIHGRIEAKLATASGFTR